MSENSTVAKIDNSCIVAGFNNSASFDFMQRQAQMLASSALMPKEFSIVGCAVADKPQKIANTMIALEMANRIGASPMMVAQNIYIVHGKPSWSSTFIIAAINGCGRFNAMKFEMTGDGDNRTCIAWTTEKGTGDKLDSPPVSIGMAKAEGWYGKAGSKWKTMPELMLRYRAATLFGRLYAPEILMGMKSVEEIEEIGEVAQTTPIKPKATDIMTKFKPPVVEEVQSVEVLDVTTGEIIEEALPAEDHYQLQQDVLQLLEQFATAQGETPDDMIDNLTNHKLGSCTDLLDKPIPYLNDMKLMILENWSNEITKEGQLCSRFNTGLNSSNIYDKYRT